VSVYCVARSEQHSWPQTWRVGVIILLLTCATFLDGDSCVHKQSVGVLKQAMVVAADVTFVSFHLPATTTRHSACSCSSTCMAYPCCCKPHPCHHWQQRCCGALAIGHGVEARSTLPLNAHSLTTLSMHRFRQQLLHQRWTHPRTSPHCVRLEAHLPFWAVPERRSCTATLPQTGQLWAVHSTPTPPTPQLWAANFPATWRVQWEATLLAR
jgi:hypothetical protein